MEKPKPKKSWRTTTLGIIAFIAMLLAGVTALLDDDPETNPDWDGILATGAVALALVTARDNKVSSQDVGIRPEEKK